MIGNVWRSKLVWWLPALIFLLLNVGALVVYRAAFAGEVKGLDQRVASREEQLERLSAQRQTREELLERAEASENGIEELMTQRLSTQRVRLTAIIAEVKDLAQRAGLAPTTINYPEQMFDEYGVVQRSIVFGVQGSYRQLRDFINLLELSDSFLILEEVRLSGSQSPNELRIALKISTLFARPRGLEDVVSEAAS